MTIQQIAYKSKASQEGFEIWQMLKAVYDIRPKTIVEIGCDGGGFLETLQLAFPKAFLIGIDSNKRSELSKYNMIYANSTDPDTKMQLEIKLNNNQIDFLFIDGDHTYEGVKSDYQMYKDFVRLGGIIGFHDTNNRGIAGVEVDKFLAELDADDSYRSLEIRAHKMSPGTRLIWR